MFYVAFHSYDGALLATMTLEAVPRKDDQVVLEPDTGGHGEHIWTVVNVRWDMFNRMNDNRMVEVTMR